MASKTTNYNLDMPGYDEVADIDVINGNMDKIDVQMKKNADSAQQSKDIVSDEYSATNTYAVGDYCIHENILYKCKTAITTGEAFDINKWVQTTCGTEFRELKNDLIWQDDKWSVLQNCTIDDDYSMLCGDMFFVCITFTTTKEISNWSFSPIWINKSLISKPNVGYPILIQGNSSAKAFVKQYSTGVSLVVDNLPIGTYTICGAFPIK